MRTQPAELATKHLSNSLHIFLRLVEVVRSLDRAQMDELHRGPRLRRARLAGS